MLTSFKSSADVVFLYPFTTTLKIRCFLQRQGPDSVCMIFVQKSKYARRKWQAHYAMSQKGSKFGKVNRKDGSQDSACRRMMALPQQAGCLSCP